ncbi:MAG: hypothetical protein ACRD3J_20410 [Thermoanaerobaculia bacterium]
MPRKANIVAVLSFLVLGCASSHAIRNDQRLFAFHSGFWLNLHHFARAVGRGMPAGGTLTPSEREAWDAAVKLYRERYVNRDLVFDDGMVAIKEALRLTPDTAEPNAPALDAELQAALKGAAPVYRAHWWPQHDEMNQRWIRDAEPLVKAHGAEISRRVAAAFGVTWPAAPIPIDLSVTAGPVGAYTTRPVATTIASTDPNIRGLASLELLFHEPSHAWGTILQKSIATAAAAHHKTVPPQLWHAVLFYNAGEITRRVLAEHGVPGYVEHAVVQKVYPDLCGDGCREKVVAAWDPRLAGKVSVDEALDKLVAAW